MLNLKIIPAIIFKNRKTEIYFYTKNLVSLVLSSIINEIEPLMLIVRYSRARNLADGFVEKFLGLVYAHNQ